MRKRIQNLALGNVDEQLVKPVFSVEHIHEKIEEGQILNGIIHIRDARGGQLRGMVFSTNPYVRVLNEAVSGLRVKVSYTVDVGGYKGIEDLCGKFIFVFSNCESSIDYRFERVVAAFDPKEGSYTDHLYEVYRESTQKAVALLKNNSFLMNLSQEAGVVRLLADGLINSSSPGDAVEEIMIALGKKPKVEFFCDKLYYNFRNPDRTERNDILIRKSTWGYVELKAETDALFIDLPRNNFFETDFVGDKLIIPFYILPERLHGGMNNAVISITTKDDLFCVNISVYKEKSERINRIIEINEELIGITDDFVQFRLGRMIKAIWKESLFRRIARIEPEGEERFFFDLIQIQALIINRQLQDARLRLNEFEMSYMRKDTPLHAYYLYVTSLLNSDPSYVLEVKNRVREIYAGHRNNRLMFWVLSLLEAEYRDSGFFLAEAESMFLGGYKSPIMYLETARLYNENPEHIVKLGKFEIQVVNWMAKNDCLSEEVLYRVCDLLKRVNRFEPILIRIFQDYIGEDFVNADIVYEAVSYMVRCRYYSEKALGIYRKAIDYQFNISGLYEAYIMSLDDIVNADLPRAVMRYFSMNSRMPELKRAAVYVNIIKHSAEFYSIYSESKPLIDMFIVNCIKSRRYEYPFYELYDLELERQLISDDMIDDLMAMMFIRRINVSWGDAVKVVAVFEALEKSIVRPVDDDTAYLPIYPGGFIAFYEDAAGKRRVVPDGDIGNNIFNRGKLMGLTDSTNDMNLYIRLMRVNSLDPSLAPAEDVFALLESPEVRTEYKFDLLKAIARDKSDIDNDLLRAAIRRISNYPIPHDAHSALLNMFIRLKDWEKAFKVVEMYGVSEIEQRELSLLAIAAVNEEQCDTVTKLSLANAAYKCGTRNHDVLEYLARENADTIDGMSILFRDMTDFGCDTYELCERMMIYMLFTGAVPKNHYDVFKTYVEQSGNRQVIEAYRNYISYRYILGNRDIDFTNIKDTLFIDREEIQTASFVRKMGFLKYLSYNEEEFPEERPVMIRELVATALLRGCYFSFFNRFPVDVKEQFLLEGVCVVSRVDETADAMSLYCIESGSLKIRDMEESVRGYFSCAVPIIDSGDSCYCKTINGRLMRLWRASIKNKKIKAGSDSRVGIINELEELYLSGDEEAFAEGIYGYKGLTKRVFDDFRVL